MNLVHRVNDQNIWMKKKMERSESVTMEMRAIDQMR